ncbi:hypothetical protein SLS56_008912 [Neofusicoccum ribis]|uniref:Uncharacterized protein n=1 Tax=Neofusicoccum ribis TaxID=45134 RepID=A0ABR3SKA9_9PEZI
MKYFVDVATTSIFINADIHNNEASFIEDFLGSLFRQLSTADSIPNDPATGVYHANEAARARGERLSVCVKLLRKALYTCLLGHSHAFLVVDDFDRCGAAVDMFLEDEFARLQRHGLKTMVTSRISFQKPMQSFSCYVEVEDGACSNMDLSVCWQCRKCSAGWDPDGGDESEHYICDGCRRKGETCRTW